MKNCEETFASAVDQPLMTEILIIASGSSGKENSVGAIKMLTEWKDQFGKNEAFPIFKNAFNSFQQKSTSISNPIANNSSSQSYV